MPARSFLSSIRRLRHAVLSVFAAGILIVATGVLLSATASATPGNGNGHGAENANAASQADAASQGSQGDQGTAHEVHTSPQPTSNADFSGNGANTHGPYDSTRDGSPSGNGNGNGNAVGKPCAGCVGKADNKNPPGQMPNGSDANAGYECDRNHGVGRTNPAHTGCRPGSPPPPPDTCPSGTPPVNGRCDGDNPGGDNPGGGGPADDDGQPPQAQPGPVPAASGAALASTGAPVLMLLALGGSTLAAGAGLVLAGRVRRRPYTP